MKKYLLPILLVVTTLATCLLGGPPPTNSPTLSPSNMVSIALKNAARIGYTVGKFGGSEDELDAVMYRVKNGNTNALNEWVSSHFQVKTK